MGLLDYMDIVKKLMHLSYICEKFKEKKYDSIRLENSSPMWNSFSVYNAVQLMDPNNAYCVAAREMHKVFRNQGKELYQRLAKRKQING